MMNETTRMYVRGNEQDCKDFTIFLAWKHSAAGNIASVNKNEDEITLNLIVDSERTEEVSEWAKNFNLKEMNF